MSGKPYRLLAVAAALSLAACSRSHIRIEQASPTGEVPTMTTFGFRFTRNVAPTDAADQLWRENEYLEFSPSLPGKCKWVRPDSLVFSPTEALLPAQDYRVRLRNVPFFGEKRTVDTTALYFHTRYFEAEGISANWRSPSENDFSEYPAAVKVDFSYEPEEYTIRDYCDLYLDGKKLEQVYFPYSWNDESSREIYFSPPEGTAWPLNLSVHLKNGLPGENGSGPLKRDTVMKARLSSQEELEWLDASGEVSEENLMLVLTPSQPLRQDRIMDYVSLEPPIPVTVEQRGNSYYLHGDFSPESYVKVRIKPGIKGKLGGTQKKEFTQTVSMPDIPASLKFTDPGGMYLMRSGYRNIGVEVVNMDAFQLEVVEIFSNNLTHIVRRDGQPWAGEYDEGYLDEYFDEDGYGRVIKTETIRLDSLNRGRRTITLNLENTFNKRFQGVYALRINSFDDYWEKEVMLISLSDIGLIARITDHELAVWTNSIGTAQPLAGVQVSLISDNNQEIAAGTTDGNGHLRITDLLRKGAGFEPRLIVARQGTDFTFLDLRHAQVNTDRFDLAGKSPWDADQACFVEERNMYRPGDTAHFAVIVRDKNWKPIAGQPYELKIMDSDYESVQTTQHITDAQGSFEGVFETDYSLPTGGYQAVVSRPGGSDMATAEFRVEEFVPDKIRVNVQPLRRELKPGDTLRIAIQGSYFFGSVCADHAYEVRVALDAAPFFSRKYPDYRFTTRFSTEDETGVLELEGKLDSRGRDTLEYIVPAVGYGEGFLNGNVQCSVYDNTGHVVKRGSSFQVYPQPWYIGAQCQETYLNAGQKLKVDFLALQPITEALTDSVTVVAYVYAKNWNSGFERYRKDLRYVSSRNDILLDSAVIRLSNKGPVHWEWPVTVSGCYELRYAHRGARTHELLDFYGYGNLASHMANFGVSRDGLVEMVMDKERYKAGETARITFKTPFSGRMLVTVERDKVYEYRYLDVRNNAAEMSLKLSGNHAPNVILTATLFRPWRGETRIPFMVAHGYQSLRVDDPAVQLPVGITAQEIYRPGKPGRMSVQIPGGADTRYVVAVVDEGILSIRNFKTSDPYEVLYAVRSLGVTSLDLYKYLLPELKPAPATGGDTWAAYKTLSPLQARRFRPMAWWSGIRRMGQGSAVNFEIPAEFNGRARIMVIAWNGRRVGHAERGVTIREDVVLMPSVPRLLHSGDSLLLPVSLINTTEKEGKIRLRLEAEGPLNMPPVQELNLVLPPNEFVDGEFILKARQATGKAKLRFTLTGMDQSVQQYELAVAPADPAVRTGDAGSLSAGEIRSIRIPAGYYPDLQETRLSLSAFPATLYLNDLQYLIQYPHGCVEQTTSALFPQLYFPEMAALAAPEQAGGGKSVKNIREGILKLESMQMYDGGMRYWPDGDYGSEWGTIYAAHFLTEAVHAGYAVDSNVMRKLVEYMTTMVRAGGIQDYTYLDGVTLDHGHFVKKEIPYALYVLALAGQPEKSVMNRYQATLRHLTTESQIMLAAACALTGSQRLLDSLAGARLNPELPTRNSVNFDSDNRMLAMILSTLLDVSPDHPWVKPLFEKVQARRNTLYSTQEKAWAWLAIGKMARRSKQQGAVVEVWDGKVRVGTFTGTDLNLLRKDWMGREIQLRATGKGVTYYSWQHRGYRAQQQGRSQPPVAHGLHLERDFHDEFGAVIPLNRVGKGDLIWYHLSVKADFKMENVAVVCPVPSGFEIENTRVYVANLDAWSPQKRAHAQQEDIRDDRMVLYESFQGGERRHYWFQMRVTAQGRMEMPAIAAEAMYDPRYKAWLPGIPVEVVKHVPAHDPDCDAHMAVLH